MCHSDIQIILKCFRYIIVEENKESTFYNIMHSLNQVFMRPSCVR